MSVGTQLKPDEIFCAIYPVSRKSITSRGRLCYGYMDEAGEFAVGFVEEDGPVMLIDPRCTVIVLREPFPKPQECDAQEAIDRAVYVAYHPREHLNEMAPYFKRWMIEHPEWAGWAQRATTPRGSPDGRTSPTEVPHVHRVPPRRARHGRGDQDARRSLYRIFNRPR